MHMLSIIKTAIITIIISFISGVLLDSYKNFAPRILCTMGKPVSLKMNDKKIWAFTLIMRNISNKIIHDLNLNIQGHYDNLRIDDAKITKGLKFETSSENNNYNISIPFLSKNDELSVKIFVESRQGKIRKPIVTLRSPEDFKRVDSAGQNGYLATLAAIPKDISDSITKRKYKKQYTDGDNSRVHNKEKSFLKNKKALIAIAGILLVIYAGVLGNEYFDKVAGKMTTSNDKANVQQTGASIGKTSNAVDDTSSITASTSSTPSKNKSVNDGSANADKTDNSSAKSSGDTSKDSIGKSASSEKNKNTKSSAGSSAKNSSTASAESESSENKDKNTSTDGNKTSSTQVPNTESNSTEKNESTPKTSTNKAASENKSEQGTSKNQSNSGSNPTPSSPSASPSSPGAGTN